MKVAIAFSVPITTAPGFGWRWRSEDYTKESAQYFEFYFDCVADAQSNGYEIQPILAHGITAPGGATWDLP